MIDRHHDLPLSRQAKVLGISRGSVYYLPRAVPAADLALMRRIDALHLEYPFAGSRMLQGLLSRVMSLGACTFVHGGEKTIQWSACVCAGAGGVKVGHWIG